MKKVVTLYLNMRRWGRAMLNDLFSVNTASFQAVFMANIGILEEKT
jgi:hypothetical protein